MRSNSGSDEGKPKKGEEMNVIKQKVGNTTIFIQTINDPLIIQEQGKEGRATQATGIGKEVKDAYLALKTFLNDTATDIGAVLNKIDSSVHPKSVELEFNVGFSLEGDIVCLSGGADLGMKVTMTWDLDKK